MRKYIFILPIIGFFLTMGCQDTLEEDFQNPNVYTPEHNVPSGLFSSMFSRTRTFKNDYGEFWWHANTGGVLAHTHLIIRHLRTSYGWYKDVMDIPSMYTTVGTDAYYYGHNGDFKEIAVMEQLINGMSEAEKKDNEIYLTLSRIGRDFRASKAVDYFNHVPYSEGLKGTEGVFFPKFDDPSEIYHSIIDNLGQYASVIKAQADQLSPSGKAVFAQQDIIFQGDADKWIQFAQALRLRLAVRISGVDPDFAKKVISEIMQSNQLPSEDLLIPNNLWVSKKRDHWKRGLMERDYLDFISPTLLYKMDKDKDHLYTEGVDDPRIPVLFLPNRDKMYMPASLDFEVGQQIYDSVRADNTRKHKFKGAYFYSNYFKDLDNYMKYNAYSVYNPATMVNNQEPWRAFTAAEVELLLAEVALKNLGGTGKSARQHVEDAVKYSIKYWYHANSFSDWDKINDTNRSYLKPEAPSAAVTDQFAKKIGEEYDLAQGEDGKMGVIIGQKYVHLNIHDYFEIFSELRRTRHPKIPLIKFDKNTTLNPVIERYPYPGSVASTNRDNYLEVQSQDNFTTHIFWVPSGLKSVKYYMDSFDDDYLYTEYPGVPGSFKTTE
ncbi:hypothetical protein FUAX_42430 (plasmid) [Fulvitalea axinellae]|uniref:SusD/RagB family nutrient-binding outer membrane lipoprotein n=1 Tax=Fulvitalea axinellae TaxID=1182444 RepID=A0AAU9CI42_9BACT|nr:hypothetical protein FUAX_42430 [Fulvitalea axinellae]